MGTIARPEPSAAVLTAEEYALFEQAARPRLVSAGDVLFRRGDLGRTMYVVVQGAMELDSGDHLPPRRIQRHGFFGELGLLIGDHARSADAVAIGSTVLLELHQDAFAGIAARAPALLAHFLRRAITRVVLGERDLIARLGSHNAELQSALDRLRATTTRGTAPTQAPTRTDELTGLANRRGFLLFLEQRRRRGLLDGSGLLLVDCDRFRRVNDERGHLAGDRVLQAVSNILRSAAGADDLPCRLGGDEFCLLLAATDREAILGVADFVVDTARALHGLQRGSPQVTTLSIGASIVAPGQGRDDWYAAVDAALYRAKRLGGNRVEWQEYLAVPGLDRDCRLPAG